MWSYCFQIFAHTSIKKENKKGKKRDFLHQKTNKLPQTKTNTVKLLHLLL